MAQQQDASTIAKMGKSLLVRQLSSVENSLKSDTPGGSPFGLLIRSSSTSIKGEDEDAFLEKHMTSFADSETEDDPDDEAEAKELESKFRRVVLVKNVQAIGRLKASVDERLVVPAKLKREQGYLELSYLRGALKDFPSELGFYTTSLQCVSRFAVVSSAKLTRKASFALYSGLEDTPSAIIQKARLKPTFYLAVNGTVVFCIRRVTGTLLRVYEGSRAREDACRFAVLFSETSVVMRVLDKGELKETVVIWTESANFAGNTCQIACGMDVMLIMACFGVAAQFAMPSSIQAPVPVREAVSHTGPPKLIRELVQQ